MLQSELARHLPLHSFNPLTKPLPEADVQAEDPTPVLFSGIGVIISPDNEYEIDIKSKSTKGVKKCMQSNMNYSRVYFTWK